MPLFELTTAETLTHTYQVEADSEEDARRRFERRYEERQVLTNESSYYTPVKSLEEETVSLIPLTPIAAEE